MAGYGLYANRCGRMTQHKDTMLGKSKWAAEKMKESVDKGDLLEARRYSEISSAYSNAAGKHCKGGRFS
jgi:hypothetical protein